MIHTYLCHICRNDFDISDDFNKTEWAEYINKLHYPVCYECFEERKQCDH